MPAGRSRDEARGVSGSAREQRPPDGAWVSGCVVVMRGVMRVPIIMTSSPSAGSSSILILCPHWTRGVPAARGRGAAATARGCALQAQRRVPAAVLPLWICQVSATPHAGAGYSSTRVYRCGRVSVAPPMKKGFSDEPGTSPSRRCDPASGWIARGRPTLSRGGWGAWAPVWHWEEEQRGAGQGAAR